MMKSILFLLLVLLLVSCIPTNQVTSERITPTTTAVSPTTTPLPTATLIPTSLPTAEAPTPTEPAIPTPTEPTVPTPTPVPSAPNQSNGRSNSPAISDDGQVIAFTSTGNLTGNAVWQRDTVFVRDLTAQTTELINITLDGQAGKWDVYGLALSGNGRVVAYYSHDGNLVPDDEVACGIETEPVSCEDLFIYDRDTAVTERIPLGRGQGLGGDYTLSLSDDSRLVAYSFHIYDRTTGLTADLPTTDGERPNGYTFAPQFAGDGRFLAFISGASNLVPNDTNEQFDIFVWDRETNQVERTSISADGTEGNETSGAMPFHEGIGSALTISGDGRFVAYGSLATNLADGVVNECADYRGFTRACYNIYLYDRQTGTTQLVTQNSDGDSVTPSLSGDGRFLAFTSLATTLTDETLPNCQFPAIVNCGQIYLYDRETGRISLISRALTGQGSDQGNWQPDFAGNGRYLTFVSAADSLVPGDTNESSDIFRFDLQTGQLERVSLMN